VLSTVQQQFLLGIVPGHALAGKMCVNSDGAVMCCWKEMIASWTWLIWKVSGGTAMRSEKFSHVEYENGHSQRIMAQFFDFILLLGLATEYSTAMVVLLHSTVQYPACPWLLHAVCPSLVVPSFSMHVQYSSLGIALQLRWVFEER